MKPNRIVVLLMLSMSLYLQAFAEEPTQSYVTIDFPTGLNTGLFGINKAGQISGTFFDKKGLAHAFFYSDGQFNQLDFPEANRTFGFGLNGSRKIVGYYITSDGATHGFLYGGSTFATIDFPGASATHASGINNLDQVVGSYSDSQNVWHGFLLEKGKFTSLDAPGATRTEAYGINDAGQIVGFYSDAKSGVHGFLDDRGKFSSIDYPGASRTSLYGINESGQVCGSYSDAKGPHGFADRGKSAKLRYPGTTLSTFAFAINDGGEVVGQYIDVDSVVHGYRFISGKNQLPQISARLDPLNITAGLPGFQLDVRGIGFAPDSVVYWNGSARPTKYVTREELFAVIPAADIAKSGIAQVAVENPGANGGKSNVVQYEVVERSAAEVPK